MFVNIIFIHKADGRECVLGWGIERGRLVRKLPLGYQRLDTGNSDWDEIVRLNS